MPRTNLVLGRGDRRDDGQTSLRTLLLATCPGQDSGQEPWWGRGGGACCAGGTQIMGGRTSVVRACCEPHSCLRWGAEDTVPYRTIPPPPATPTIAFATFMALVRAVQGWPSHQGQSVKERTFQLPPRHE